MKATVLIFTFLFVITPIAPAFAQEAKPPIVSEPLAQASQGTRRNAPEPKKDTPAEAAPESVKPAEDSTSVAEQEKPKGEKPPEEEPQPMAAASPQTSGVNFEIPTQAQAKVDQSTGALMYEYPIKLPEGRAGMTPELSLTYNSRNASKPDGIAGLGWEISIPYIMREPGKGTDNLYSQAFFSSLLSGNLIATTDTASSQYTTYRPETDNGDYLKYTYNSDNTWTMTGKNGRTYTFGGTAASRQDNPNDSTKVFKWMVSKIADPNGNEIQYSYVKDSGQIYPSRIIYTYNVLSPAANTVDFTYTTPGSYGSTVYNSAFPVTTYKLLNYIVITTTDDSGTSSTTYGLTFSAAQFLKQRLLTDIGMSGNFIATEVGQSVRSTQFSYSTKTPGWEQSTYSLQDVNNYSNLTVDNHKKRTQVADFDLNGYPDILIGNYYNNVSYNTLLLNSGTTFIDSTVAWSVPTNADLSYDYAIADVNGDRLPDLYPRNWSPGSPIPPLYLNTGSGFAADTSNTWLMDTYVPEVTRCGPNVGDAYSYNTNTFLYDINHDGKNDIVYFGGASNFKVYVNNGNGWSVSTAYTFTINPGSTYDFSRNCGYAPQQKNFQTLIDVNGDGLEDYVHIQYGTYLNTGSGFAYSSAYTITFPSTDNTGFADINGDGLVDLLVVRLDSNNRCLQTYINTGAGFSMVYPVSASSCTTTNVWDSSNLGWFSTHSSDWGSLVDVTGDGYPDIINYATGGKGKVWNINDSLKTWVTNTDSTWAPIAALSYDYFFDINSDGVTDFISPSTSWGGSAPSKVYMGKSAVPNRLTKITNMLGAETAIEYATAQTNYDDTGVSPMPVVKKITIQNIGDGQPDMVTQYAYVGGAYTPDPTTGRKRFAGFHKVTATESGADLSPLRITDTCFHQADGSDASTNEPTDTSPALIGKPYYRVTRHPSGTPKKETWNKYGLYTLVTEPATSRVSHFVYPTETVIKTTESSATTATAEAYTFDTVLGEQTELQNLGFVAADLDGNYTNILGDTRYKFTEYATNSGSTIVKPKRVDIRTSPSLGDTVTRTDYFYDNQSFGNIGMLGNLTKETKWISGNDAITADTTYTYDSLGNVLTITNPRNATTTYTYDTNKSQIASETNQLNQTTSYEYKTGKLTKVTDPNGRITTYGYSDIGWLYRTTMANTGGSYNTRQWMEQQGGVTSIIETKLEPQGYTNYTIRTIDRLARPLRVMKLKENYATGVGTDYYIKSATAYDALGQPANYSAAYGMPSSSYITLATVTIPLNLTTTTNYDVFNRPTSIINALGTTTLSYAGAETTTTDANGKQKKAGIDAYGNIVQVKEYNGGSTYTTNYTYDIRNLLTSLTDAFGNVRNFTYNNAGWLTNSEDLHASADTSFGSYSFTYDLNGNKLVETQPNGITVTRVYDLLDRPTSIDSSSTAATDYILTYDSCTNGKGRLCTVSGTLPDNITLSKTYAYGVSGVPTSTSITTLGSTYTTSYLYNYSDQVAKITYPDNTIVRYTFGDWALPYQVYTTLPGGTETLFATVAYNHNDQPLTINFGSGLAITNTYDSAKLYRKTNMTATQGGTTLQSFGYTYDNVNNITQITEPNLTKTYTYDDLYRLTQAIHTPSGGQATTYTYAYDALGNITGANGISYTYSGTGKTNPHAVTSIGSDNYTYDDNGNIATSPNQVYTFNWQNQPTRITLGGSTTIGSYYDEKGQRFIYQTQSSTEVQVDDTYLVRGGIPEISLKLADVPVGTISNGMLYSAIADHLGTPVKRINSSGTVTEAVAYGPFGAVLSHTGTLNTKYGYIGQEYDADTGLNYLNARYYNSAIGRFISQDPVFLNPEAEGSQIFSTFLRDPQQQNSYSYARNNPITLSDPNGKTVGEMINGGGLGFFQGLGDVAIGSLYAVTHPIETAKFVAQSVANAPQNAVDAYQGFKNGDDFTNAYVLGNAGAQIFLSIKGGKRAEEGRASVNTSTNWATPNTLYDHFSRHGSDFGFKNATEYANSAQSLFRNTNSTERFVGKDGTIRVYDSKSNTFGSYTSSGQTKTLFKPKGGFSYWKKQIKKYAK